MQQFVQKIRFSAWSVPLALLAACVLAFGLFIPWLGYYHDGWHFVYYSAMRGPQGLADMFAYDGHPLAVWSYLLSFGLLGYKPIFWHIYALIWRWLAVTMFWLCLKRLWPERPRQAFTAALLYAVYPLFVIQFLPISYFEVWVSAFLLWLSFFWMQEALRRPEKSWLFSGLAILAKIAHMLTSEYTWGLELVRPLFIWFMLPEKLPIRQKLRQTFVTWLPYLTVFVAFAAWRSVFYQAGRKEIKFQSGLLTDPVASILGLISSGLPDVGLILFTSWYNVLEPAYLNLGERFNGLILVLVILSAAGAFLALSKLLPTDDKAASNDGWMWQAALIGMAGVLVGLIPSYAAGYAVYNSAPPGNTRFALGALPGAALLITALLEGLIASRRARMAFVAILVGLAIGWHARYTNEFRNLWIYQTDFYRQLSWRAPGLQPGTALVAAEKFFPPITYPSAILAVNGDYPTALAINTLYGGQPASDGQLPYWFFPSLADLDASAPLSSQHLNLHFGGELKNSLVFLYQPQNGSCLRLLRPEDGQYRRLPEPAKTFAPSASLDGVALDAQTDFRLLNTLLGPENTNTWCYFYEKADLAAQHQDWSAIPPLWKSASHSGLRPADGREYLPFVEAAIRLQDWETALALTRAAKQLTPNMADLYCPLWANLAPGQSAAQNLLDCPTP
jgi:hypothetical protein